MSSIKVKKATTKSNSFIWLMPLFIITGVYYLGALFLGFETLCIFKNTTGMPCPGCGMTRSIWSVLHGDFSSAFYWHPLWPLVFLGLVAVGYKVLSASGWVKTNRALDRLLNANWFWLVMLFTFIIVYLVRLVLYFPTQEPLDYETNNILFNLLRWIQSIVSV